MDIDRCNSIFELFTAFNFTYAVLSHPDNSGYGHILPTSSGKSFSELVDGYLIKPYARLHTRGQQIENSLDTFRGSALTAEQDSKKRVALETIQDFRLDINLADKMVKTWKRLIESNREAARNKINSRFPGLSFILALFCVAVLILAASESDHKHVTLLVLDIVLLVIILIFRFSIWVAWLRKNQTGGVVTTMHRGLSFHILLCCFFVGLILVTFFHFYFKYSVQFSQPELYCRWVERIDLNEDFRPFFVLLNLLLPFSHFVYYFLAFWWRRMFDGEESKKQLKLINETLIDLNNQHRNIVAQIE